MTEDPKPKRKWRRRVFVACILLLALMASMLSRSPSTPASSAPDATVVAQAKGVFDRVRPLAQSGKPAKVTLSWAEASSIATLAGHASSIDRARVSHDGDQALLAASHRLPAGFWLNIAAEVQGSENGFPPVSLKIGHLHLPRFASRWLISLAHGLANRRGAQLPPLDELVRSLKVTQAGATGVVQLPTPNAAINPIAPIDMAAVTAAYCRISALQRKRPVTELPLLLNRAFKGRPGSAEENRAIFIALAILIVPDRTERLVGEETDAMRACAAPNKEIHLLGRPDLPKHWTLSAALSAGFGQGITQAMGTWKEIADSGPGGSGFSFVDLSADRSGTRFGQLAAAPETSARTALRLATAQEEDILPLHALALSEGLTEVEFKARFTNTESRNYDAMVARIDRVLNRQD